MHTDILFTIWTVVELLLMCCCENYMSYMYLSRRKPEAMLSSKVLTLTAFKVLGMIQKYFWRVLPF